MYVCMYGICKIEHMCILLCVYIYIYTEYVRFNICAFYYVYIYIYMEFVRLNMCAFYFEF